MIKSDRNVMEAATIPAKFAHAGWRRLLLVGALVSTAVVAAAMAAPSAPKAGGDVVAVRRITESQYRHAIADVFGPQINVNARFEPEARSEGLLAIGASDASISANGLQQYFAAARGIAAHVAPDGQAAAGPCSPPAPAVVDDACAALWVRTYGERLFRRPLSEREVKAHVSLAGNTAASAGQFNAGLRAALVSLMTAPDFLFRIERRETAAGSNRLDAYSRAARISYLLWDAPPDEVLLRAARSGELMTTVGLQAQVDRLSASPRLEDGIRAFFSDFLQLDLFDGLTKDPAQYPKFSQLVATSAKEQTLKVVVNELMKPGGDYRNLFTTRDTFVNRPLGSIYRVPVSGSSEWMPHRFDEASGQSGLLTQVTFAALFAHPGRTSPTKRGAAVNEIFLCMTVPQPPADVDLSGLNNANNPGKTVRERLQFHRDNPTCQGCHTLTDPMGLTLEEFDSTLR